MGVNCLAYLLNWSGKAVITKCVCLQLSVHWRQADKCASLTCSCLQRPKPEPHGQTTPHKVSDAAWQNRSWQPLPTGRAQVPCSVSNYETTLDFDYNNTIRLVGKRLCVSLLQGKALYVIL